jgi:5-formyltetrahydrofolate cyclo-ligase
MHDLKEHFRARLTAVRRTLPAAIRAELGHQVIERVAAWPLFRTSAAVLLYDAIDGELDPAALRTAADAVGKSVYYPRVANSGSTVVFVHVAPGEGLKRGRWGIGEPTGNQLFRAESPALVIVPGVAFDPRGTRLGRGLGCYDRALRHLGASCASIGLAFSVQLVPSLPREDHDEPVGFIAIETEILRCAPSLSSPERPRTLAN